MGPVTLLPSLPPSRLRRDLLLDTTSWAGIGIITTLLGSILPAALREAGMDPMGLAVLSALPFAAAILALAAGRFGPRTPLALALTRSLGAAALGASAFGVAVLGSMLTPRAGTWLPVLGAAVFWLCLMLSMPLQQRLWGVMYPGERQARLLALVTSGRYAAAALVLALAGGLALRLDGLALVALGGLLGVASALAAAGFARGRSEPGPRYSPGRALGAILRHRFLRGVTLAHGLWGGGLVAAAPLVVLVQVDRLGLSVAEVGGVAMAGVLATAASLFAWGGLVDRRGPLTAMSLAGLLGAAGIALHATAGSILAASAGAVLIGLAFAAAEVAVPVLVVARAAPADREPATAGMNAILGLRGLLLPLLAVLPVSVGLLDAGAALLGCAIVSGVGALAYKRMSRLEEAPRRVDEERRLRVPPQRSAPVAGEPVLVMSGARFAALR